MRTTILLLIVTVLIAGCDSDENLNNKCFQGNVISYNCCSGISEVSLTKYIQGSKRITLSGTEYKNVIRVPGHIDDQHIYITLKKYDSEKDSHLLDGFCLCALEIVDPPNYTITAKFTAGCP